MGAHLGLHLKNEQKRIFRQLRVKEANQVKFHEMRRSKRYRKSILVEIKGIFLLQGTIKYIRLMGKPFCFHFISEPQNPLMTNGN